MAAVGKSATHRSAYALGKSRSGRLVGSTRTAHDAGMLDRQTICTTLADHFRSVPAHDIRRRLSAIGDPHNFTFQQALWLAALARQIGADVAIDLGTGLGNSAATLGTVCQTVHSFDHSDHWRIRTLPDLTAAALPAFNVKAYVGDMTKVDFRPLLKSAKSVVVFWDAHGFDIAELVFSHIMPLIADKPHVVVCHDISDSRHISVASYNGKRLWRGQTEFYRQPDAFAYVNVGWAIANVDQVIPISDFCARNGMELGSADQTFAQLSVEDQQAVTAVVGLSERPYFHMAYFSMNQTRLRHFPSMAHDIG